jgi:NADPH-dependent curcumin reductase CurA
MGHDDDPFNRWEAGQRLATRILLGAVASFRASQAIELPAAFIDAFGRTLADPALDGRFKALALSLPDFTFLGEQMAQVDVEGLHAAREAVVGQLAKMQGCRAVGIAGGKAKSEYVVKELGFDACIDYKAGHMYEDLKAACPDGIDCYFENVGGATMDTVFRLLNPFSRVALCGLISDYNLTDPYGVKMIRSLLVNRVKLQGFIVFDRQDLYQQAIPKLAKLVASGRLKYRESVADGLQNAPTAFIGLLAGRNFGKQLVKLI